MFFAGEGYKQGVGQGFQVKLPDKSCPNPSRLVDLSTRLSGDVAADSDDHLNVLKAARRHVGQNTIRTVPSGLLADKHVPGSRCCFFSPVYFFASGLLAIFV